MANERVKFSIVVATTTVHGVGKNGSLKCLQPYLYRNSADSEGGGFPPYLSQTNH